MIILYYIHIVFIISSLLAIFISSSYLVYKNKKIDNAGKIIWYFTFFLTNVVGLILYLVVDQKYYSKIDNN